MHMHFREMGALGQGGICPCNSCAPKDLPPEEIDAITHAQAPYGSPYETADQEDMMTEGDDNILEEESGSDVDESDVEGLGRMGGRKLFRIVDASGREIARVRGKVIRTAEGYKALLENGQTVKMIGYGAPYQIPTPFTKQLPEVDDEDDEDAEDGNAVRPRNELNDVFNDDLEIF